MSTPMTFQAWLQQTLDADQLADLARYGAAGGFPGLTYYRETGALYERYHDEIWEALYDDAQDFGYRNPLAFVADLGGSKDVATGGQFANLCVWYLAERTAQQLAEEGAR